MTPAIALRSLRETRSDPDQPVYSRPVAPKEVRPLWPYMPRLWAYDRIHNSAQAVLVMILRLRQLSTHPSLILVSPATLNVL